MPIMEKHTDAVHPHAAALPMRGSPVAASPPGGTKPRGGGDTHAGSRGALQQHLLLFSLAVSSFFFSLWAMNNENKNEKESGMTVNYCLCD